MEINKILEERGKNYGEFSSHAVITQQLKENLYITPGWQRMTYSQREALDMIMHKISRILNGDPNYKDSWVDIVGYAQLIVNELENNNI